MSDRLPSWRPGPTRDAVLAFLDGSGDVPVDERVAYIDNDGTMWCEKPGYVQLDFFVDALQQRTRCFYVKWFPSRSVRVARSRAASWGAFRLTLSRLRGQHCDGCNPRRRLRLLHP